MTDSNEREALDAMRAENRERRIEGVKRWVEYIRAHDAETWGPQLNGLVNSQLDAARSTDVSAEHRQRVDRLAREVREAATDADSETRTE